MDGTEFTVFFEDPFWVGVLVIDRGDSRLVSRVVFGAEPTNAELLLFMGERFAGLLRTARRVPRSDQPGPMVALSAKRGTRMAAREQRSGPSKAVAAAHAAFELAKAETRRAGSDRREEDEELRFKARQEKKKAARRGK